LRFVLKCPITVHGLAVGPLTINSNIIKSGLIAKKLDMALPTVKKSLAELVLKGTITKEGQGKSTGYFVV
jgi:hypothetical protein